MFFTIEDYKKIQEWLSRNSIKDTEFNEAMQPFKGNEIISFVQNGHNTKAYLKDFVDQLFLLGIPDFVNVTEKFNESNISLSRAIQLIPYKSRKIGQVITFLNEEGVWKIYQFKGKRKNQWNEESLWIDLIKDIAGKITTLADEEDLTTIEENGATVFKFKDKVYNPDNFSGKGRVYLRKNIVTVEDPETGNTYSTNLLTQEMLGRENTIYIIQYDYNLNGQTITIPEGCILQFEGGSISNGTFAFTGTYLYATYNSFNNIIAKGTISNQEVYADWFNNAEYNTFLQVCADSLVSDIYFSNKEYYFETRVIFPNPYTIRFHGHNTTFKVDEVWRNTRFTSVTEVLRFTPSTTNTTDQVGDVYFENITFVMDNANFPINEDTSNNYDVTFIYCELVNSLVIHNCKFKTTANRYSGALFFKSFANAHVMENCYVENTGICHVGGCVSMNHGWNAKTQEKLLTRNLISNCIFISHAGDEMISLYKGTSTPNSSFTVFQNSTFIAYANEARGSKMVNIVPSNAANTSDISASRMYVDFINCQFIVIGRTNVERIYSAITYGQHDNPISDKNQCLVSYTNCSFEGGYTSTNYYTSGAFQVNGNYYARYMFNNCVIRTSDTNIRLVNARYNTATFIFNSCDIATPELYKNDSDSNYFGGNLILNDCKIVLTGIYSYWLRNYYGGFTCNNTIFKSNNNRGNIISPTGGLLTRYNIIPSDMIINNSWFSDIHITDVCTIDDDYIISFYNKAKGIIWSTNTPYSIPLTIYNQQHFTASVKDIVYDAKLGSSGVYEVAIYSGLTGSHNEIILKKDDGMINRSYFKNISRTVTNFPVIKKSGIDNTNMSSDIYRDNVDKGNFYLDLNSGRYYIWNGNNYNAITLNHAGKSTERPSNPVKGDIYYDTTLNKPIWWTGSQWVDATGASV